ncbi:MAG: SLC13 family permease [Anaerolineae bacterium]|nr:SLC13 family permease [Anaerolineae bacterium]
MDFQIILMLFTLTAAVILFSFEWLPADINALLILLFLILTGLLPLHMAFHGFGSEVFVMVFGLLILTAAMTNTGVTEYAGVLMQRWTGSNGTTWLVLVIMSVATVTSAFISNTASTALLLPIVTGLARQAKLSPSKVLMPLSFAAIAASSLTLIGTSTNIVVSGMMIQSGMLPIGMFELTPAGIPIAIVSVLYMVFIGRRLVPDRAPVEPDEEEYSSRIYLTEIRLKGGSSLIGKTLLESRLGLDQDLNVLRVIRDGRRTPLQPRASTRLEEGDRLLIEGRRADILDIKDDSGIDIGPDVDLESANLESGDMGLSEVVLLTGSPLLRRTLKGANVRQRYDLQVLAINRRGETLTRKMGEVRLRVGDILLVQGDRQQIATLEQQNIFQLLGTVSHSRPNRRRAPLAIAIFLGAVVVSAFNILSPAVAMLLGATLAMTTRCITPEEAYKNVQWTALIVIACMLGLGVAMESTGTAAFLAEQIAALSGSSHPIWLLSAFFILTVLLTQPMSNQASAAVVFPVAIQSAAQLGLNPRSFAIIIALAASCSFITPLEPASLMVYGPGQYRFSDFIKVGAPLTLLIYLISIVLVPILWPL